MNNIILTAFYNRYPLNSFSVLAFKKNEKLLCLTLIDLTCILCTIGFYRHIQYHVLLRHVPAWLLLLIAVK